MNEVILVIYVLVLKENF